VEADDDGLYVLKFRGAGQGIKALVAEIVAGELARALGLAVPEIVLMSVDRALGAAEPVTMREGALALGATRARAAGKTSGRHYGNPIAAGRIGRESRFTRIRCARRSLHALKIRDMNIGFPRLARR
jgi:hypothetical protein